MRDRSGSFRTSKMLRSLSILILLFPFALQAQECLVIDKDKGLFNIGLHACAYEDKTATLTIEQISSHPYSGKFVKNTAAIPNYNITGSRIWERIEIVNRTDKNDWFLESNNASIRVVEFYRKTPAGFEMSRAGFSTALSDRELYTSRPQFHLDLPKDSLKTFYICISDKVPLQFNFSIGDAKSLIAQTHKLDFLNGAFFGLLFMLVVYNLFIFFSVRDKVFIFYVLYIASNALFISYITGYVSHMPLALLRFIECHPPIVPLLLGIFSSVFLIVFLDLKNNYKPGYNFVLGVFGLGVVVLLLDIVGNSAAAIILIQLVGIGLSVMSLFFGIKVWKKGYKPAKFFLIGWTFYLVGLFMYIAADTGILPFNDLTHNALQIGTAMESILLSLAVGDKISNFKKDKELAQESALDAARENERLIREQNAMLEQKVNERTIELQQQKAIVEQKNKDILDSIHYARRIQQSLLPQEVYIKRLLSRFKR
ncbi:MAG: 7TM diverse intracellular signaling domain-containing protein [Bacteroidia bacterium]